MNVKIGHSSERSFLHQSLALDIPSTNLGKTINQSDDIQAMPSDVGETSRHFYTRIAEQTDNIQNLLIVIFINIFWIQIRKIDPSNFQIINSVDHSSIKSS